MTRPNQSPFLARLAAAFRASGDSATADALVFRSSAASESGISDEDQREILALQRRGIRMDNAGAHEDAERLFERALALVESALGPDHAELSEPLNDLARSRFNGGHYEAALCDYRRLLRLMIRVREGDTVLVSITRQNIRESRQRRDASDAARRLHAQMNVMLRGTVGARNVNDPNYCNRMREIAVRLIARGRLKAGARVFERWTMLRVRKFTPESEADLTDLRDYAVALWNNGELEQAAQALKALVIIRNRCLALDGGSHVGLQQALADWGSCLAAMGNRQSAAETAVLAESIRSTQAEE
jgi:tetratricopeptide (TPR) repeat protein